MLQLSRKLTLGKETLLSPNLTGEFSGGDLDAIGQWVKQGYDQDVASRQEWLRRNSAGMDLAMQVTREKTFPWKDCANVAFPLVTIATLQFHSRAYPEIVQGNEVVRYRVLGDDADGTQGQQAALIGSHMSYQVLEEDTAWEEQHDRLLINVPIVGCAFKKSYYDADQGHNVSELVLAKDMVMNYYAKSVESCQRKTHRKPKYRNEIYTAVKRGIYRDILGEAWYKEPSAPVEENQPRRDGTTPPSTPDDATPMYILEQHCCLDLDGDGYAEPLVITVDEQNCKVLRIVTRFDREEDIERTASGEVLRINATEYFTKYGFIPSPDGSVYDMGYGLLLGPLNHAVNTNINQLLDAGTWSMTAGGFLGRGAKIRGGSTQFAPLEWKRVDSTGDDLRKNIVPLDVREPSNVMFQLLGLLIQYTDRIAGSTEANVGENVGQNTKAATFEGMVEQGSKVYAAIFKRIWRSMKQEFKKLFLLNAVNLPQKAYFGDNQMIGAENYKANADRICPVADPNVVSEHTRVVRAMTIADRAHAVGGYNVDLAEMQLLRAVRTEGYKALYPGIAATPPQKDAKLQIAEMKAEVDHAKLEQAKLEFLVSMQEEMRVNQAQIILWEAQAKKAESDAASEAGWQQIEMLNATINIARQRDDTLRSKIELALKAFEIKTNAKLAKEKASAA
jgi:chaperonin GroES